MASIQDERGYNQGFKPTEALRIRTQRRADLILSKIDKTKKNITLLELGCGTGELTKYMANSIQGQVVGLDLSDKFVRFAKQHSACENNEFVCSNFLEFDEQHLEKYDYIIGNGILHHLFYNLDEAVLKIKTLLKPGGKLIFWEPNLYNPYVCLIFKWKPFRNIAKLEPAEMAFTKEFINSKLKKNGFQSKVKHLDFLLPNTPTFLIKPFIILGTILEHLPLLNRLSQSIFIVGKK